jgi:hypothetical protein
MPTPSPSPGAVAAIDPGLTTALIVSLWIAIATAVLTLLGVLVTQVVAYWNARTATLQKERADRRDAWWKRAQWAMERCYDSDQLARAVGTTALQRLGRSPLATADDQRMLRDVAVVILNANLQGSSGGGQQ